jgi:hypothetical protein
MKKGDLILFSAMGAMLVVFLPIGLILLFLCIMRGIVMIFFPGEEEQHKQKKYKLKEYSEEIQHTNK